MRPEKQKGLQEGSVAGLIIIERVSISESNLSKSYGGRVVLCRKPYLRAKGWIDFFNCFPEIREGLRKV